MAEMVCSGSSIECTDTRSEYATDGDDCSSSANLFCYILNDNTQLIKSQLKDCSSSSNSFTQMCLVKSYTSTMVGNLIIDVDLPTNIIGMIVINAIDQDYFRITTSAENSFLTSLSFYASISIFDNETIFNFFVNLRSLNILGNVISDEIPSFTNLHSLTYLSSGFQASGTPRLDSSMVSGLENLVFLYIRNSNFQEINLDAFQNLNALTFLTIYSSPFLTLQNGVFDSLTRLVILQLGSTSISHVGNSVFEALNQLKYFALYDSPNFPLESLAYARGLEGLILGYGSYSTLDPFLFQQLISLTYLHINDNPILCDCNLEWIPNLAQQGVNILGSCSFPISAQGISISNSLLYINCSQTESYQCFNRSITCPSNEFCHNTGDCYTCGCIPGYVRLNTGECLDDNECSRPNKCQYSCTNTDGSYYCNCSEGFQISTNGYSCEDINECQVANGGCEGICNNTVGSYSCDFSYRINSTTNFSVLIYKISLSGVILIGVIAAGAIISTMIVYIIALKMKITKLNKKESNHEESTYEEIGPHDGMQVQNNIRNDPNQSELHNPLFEIHTNPTVSQEDSKQSDTKAAESGHILGRKIHIDSKRGKFGDYYEQVEMEIEYSSLSVPYEAISNEEQAEPSDITVTEREYNSRIEYLVVNDTDKMDKLYEQVGVYSSLPTAYEAISNEEHTKPSDITETEREHNSRSEFFVGYDTHKMGKHYRQVEMEYSSLPVSCEAISNEEHRKRSDITETGVGLDSRSELLVNGDKEKMDKLYEQVGVEYSSLPAPYESISNEEHRKRSDIAATEREHNSRCEFFIGGDKEKMDKLYEQVGVEYSSLPAPYESISNEEHRKRSDVTETGVGHDSQSEFLVNGVKEKMDKHYEQVGEEYSSLPAPYEAISNEEHRKRSDIAETGVGDDLQSEFFVDSDKEKMTKLYEQVDPEYSSLPVPIPEN